MKMKDYIKDSVFQAILGLLVIGVFMLFFRVFGIPQALGTAVIFIFGMYMFSIFLYQYFRKKKFYDELIHNTERLDKKYLVLETIKQPVFYEGRMFCQVLYDIDKSMCENVNNYKCQMNDFKDFIEMWVHEVKIPLASLELMCHNNKQVLEPKFRAQLQKLNQYVDQVLYYTRSEHKEKDYLITEVDLQKCITGIALKNREELLQYKIDLTVDTMDIKVMSDGKWLAFILNQIVNNCMKYRDENKQSYIHIFVENLPDSVQLHIQDNGIGICPADLPKVWDKSFTGKNGRDHVKSTGMGLYIVKQLCASLGHKAEIVSNENEYTEVILTFGKNDYYNLTKS